MRLIGILGLILLSLTASMGWTDIGLSVAISAIPLFYAMLLSECIVRPAFHRIEHLVSRDESTEGTR